MANVYWYDFPVAGRLGVTEDRGLVTRVLFPGDAAGGYDVAESAPIQEAAAQLREYFEGRRAGFTVRLWVAGTPFQLAVWKALREIPLGQTRTYGQIAAQIGKPGAARAVGAACGANPVPVVVPCHRAIGANGKLTGFAGGIDLKRALLDHERRLSLQPSV